MRSKPQIEKFRTPPFNSYIEKEFPKIDYCDSFSLRISNEIEISNDEIFNLTFEYPKWIRTLFIIRDFFVKPFGLETDFEVWKKSDFYAVGDKIKFFEVIYRDDHEIVMGGTDSHLQGNFSVMQVEKQSCKLIYFTTIVHFHHIGGRIYFIPVRPFHAIIIKHMLKKLHKTLQNENK